MFENVDMRLTADLLETIREQLDLSKPYVAWDFINIDGKKFDSDLSLKALIQLRESYYALLFQQQLASLDQLFDTNKDEARKLWYKFYVDAAIYFRDEFIYLLCVKRNTWDKGAADNYIKIATYIRENRWPDCVPFYNEIAENSEVPAEIRAQSQIVMAQIIIYYYPETSLVSGFLESAAKHLPHTVEIKRAEAEHLIKKGSYQEAQDLLVQTIASKPADYSSISLMGDCFFVENKLESAEFWYNEATRVNFLQHHSYKRLLNLYCLDTWIKDKEPLILTLLEKIESRPEVFLSEHPLIPIDRVAGSFENLVIYDSYRELGLAWLVVKEWDKAEFWLTKAIKLQPLIAPAYLNIASLYKENGQNERELSNLLKALQVDPENFDAHMALADYYDRSNRKMEALDHYEKSISIRPHWADWVYNFIGNVYFSIDNFEKSEHFYQKALDLNGNQPVYRENLAGAIEAHADALTTKLQFDEAQSLYLRAVQIDDGADRWNAFGTFYMKKEDWHQALECFSKAIDLEPDRPDIYENIGDAYQNLDRLEDAERSFLKALEIAPTDDIYANRLGVFYYETKNYKNAEQYYREALAKNPSSPVYLQNICLTFVELNELDQAEPFCLGLIEKEPSNGYALNLLGTIYYHQKKYDASINCFIKAIDVDPSNIIYYENLSSSYRETNQFLLAIGALEKAHQLDPGNDVILNNIGVLYFSNGDFGTSIEFYFKALLIKPSTSLYLKNIAASYDLLNEFDKAVEYYQKALEFDPDNAPLLNAIGLMLYYKRDYGQAITFYSKALGLDSNNGTFQSNLALALNGNGQVSEAIEAYREAIKLKPDYYLNWNDLGILLYQIRNFNEAIECYNQAILLSPTDAVLYVNLSLALYESDKAAEALNVLSHPQLDNETESRVESLLKQAIPALF
ncbi:tetratricopeptide repeat protein [Dyadobacter arcticus]|uniref:Tetratricopeptide (TPR) repeat protein n=1 Tax=Dyadobacter arcticus TaxID=1078754 RepID=A0ABX0UUW9_9BACT|nr:tetratricopeptide repeat protein [Dyadobacter arcticus]NIJ55435.1 tetratricopeptide (TPR) repeat protein [Dyadobacter arcticus]